MKYQEYDRDILKHLQNLELMILKDVIAICEQNDIEYFLYAGSNLGAVRHNGFIPWDDDVDVAMFRKDYEKFLKIMSENLPDKYELLTEKDEDNYFLLFSKVMLKGTAFDEWWAEQVDFHQGIFIDIFPLDNLSDNFFKRKYQLIVGRMLDRLITMSSIRLEGYPKSQQIPSNIMHRILRLLGISPRFLKGKVEKLLREHESEECETVCDISALRHPQVYKRSDFTPARKVKFEDIEANIPNKAEKLLKQVYGDYMKLPPEEDRYNHVTYNLDFGPYDLK